MSTEIYVAMVAGASALIGGFVASVISPLVHWGIDKQRDRRNARRELIQQAREYIGSNTFSVSQFAHHALYHQLKSHLSEEAINVVENIDHIYECCDMDVRLQDLKEDVRRKLFDQTTKIERSWGLV